MKTAIADAESSDFLQVPSLSTAEPDLVRGARCAAAAAALLLAATGYPLLTLASERAPRTPRTRILYWTDSFEPRAEGAEVFFADPALRDALSRLRHSGAEIARQLSRRWPPNAVPEVIGVITDGIGMAVSGGHPSALDPQWFTDHVTNRARVSVLLPFGKRGAWTLLARSSSPRLLQ